MSIQYRVVATLASTETNVTTSPFRRIREAEYTFRTMRDMKTEVSGTMDSVFCDLGIQQKSYNEIWVKIKTFCPAVRN